MSLEKLAFRARKTKKKKTVRVDGPKRFGGARAAAPYYVRP